MKKVILTALMALVFLVVSAQENSYIVKTRNVKKGVTPELGTDLEALMQQEETAADFIGQNFKFYSLCDWEEGMKFMVLPEKYDLVTLSVRTMAKITIMRFPLVPLMIIAIQRQVCLRWLTLVMSTLPEIS